jgi:hypothetical protein
MLVKWLRTTNSRYTVEGTKVTGILYDKIRYAKPANRLLHLQYRSYRLLPDSKEQLLSCETAAVCVCVCVTGSVCW